METFLIVAAVLAVLFVVGLIVAAADGAEKRKAAEEALRQVQSDLGLDEAYVSPFGMDLLGIRWDDRRLFCGKAPHGIVEYHFDQLRSSELELDGVTVTRSDSTTKTRRGAQVGGAAVGGLVFGPAGLLVGGLTGGSRTSSVTSDTQHVCSIAIVLRFHDQSHPTQRISFWDMQPPGIDRHNQLLRPITEKANRFQAFMVQIIEDQLPSEEPVRLDPSEKLERLWALHQAGALTEAEFNKQKRDLLRE